MRRSLSVASELGDFWPFAFPAPRTGSEAGIPLNQYSHCRRYPESLVALEAIFCGLHRNIVKDLDWLNYGLI